MVQKRKTQNNNETKNKIVTNTRNNSLLNDDFYSIDLITSAVTCRNLVETKRETTRGYLVGLELIGEPGCGKTEYVRALSDSWGLNRIFLNIQSSMLADLFRGLSIRESEDTKPNYKNVIRTVLNKNLQPLQDPNCKPTVIIFDDYNRANINEQQIIYNMLKFGGTIWDKTLYNFTILTTRNKTDHGIYPVDPMLEMFLLTIEIDDNTWTNKKNAKKLLDQDTDAIVLLKDDRNSFRDELINNITPITESVKSLLLSKQSINKFEIMNKINDVFIDSAKNEKFKIINSIFNIACNLILVKKEIDPSHKWNNKNIIKKAMEIFCINMLNYDTNDSKFKNIVDKLVEVINNNKLIIEQQKNRSNYQFNLELTANQNNSQKRKELQYGI